MNNGGFEAFQQWMINMGFDNQNLAKMGDVSCVVIFMGKLWWHFFDDICFGWYPLCRHCQVGLSTIYSNYNTPENWKSGTCYLSQATHVLEGQETTPVTSLLGNQTLVLESGVKMDAFWVWTHFEGMTGQKHPTIWWYVSDPRIKPLGKHVSKEPLVCWDSTMETPSDALRLLQPIGVLTAQIHIWYDR